MKHLATGGKELFVWLVVWVHPDGEVIASAVTAESWMLGIDWSSVVDAGGRLVQEAEVSSVLCCSHPREGSLS